MYTVKVKFQNQQAANKQTYTYLVKDAIQLELDDLVVVPVLQGDVFKVAQVVDVSHLHPADFIPNVGYRWLTCKVDLSGYSTERKIMLTDVKKAKL